MLTLLWGIPDESPMRLLRAELTSLDAPVVIVDQHDAANIDMELSVGREISGWIQTTEGAVALGDVTAIYVRPYDPSSFASLQEAGQDSQLWRHTVALEEVMRCWIEVTPALVVNRFEPMASNGSKPYQLERIRRAGFATPDTLVTNDPQAVLEFWERHQQVIYKSVSGVRSIVAPLRSEHKERLANVVHCPTQFQQYIAGIDHRVHVVGDEVFACKIVSDAADYRYPGDDDVTIEAVDLPLSVADRCRKLAHSLCLPFAGVDLRHSDDDEWYCFEVNPSPGYSYYQSRTDLPISSALARLLMIGHYSCPVGRIQE